jgi:hypothetical protein
LTRAIPGARLSGALRASKSAVLPICQPLCHLSTIAPAHCALTSRRIQHMVIESVAANIDSQEVIIANPVAPVWSH